MGWSVRRLGARRARDVRAAGLLVALLAAGCKGPPPPSDAPAAAIPTATVDAAVDGSGSAPPDAGVPAEPHAFWLVLTEGGAPLLALGLGRNEWGTGAPALVGDTQSITAVRRAVDLEKVPEAARLVVGRKIRLFDADGNGCGGEVVGLEMLERLYAPGDALLDRWPTVSLADRERDPELVAAAKTAWAREARDRTLVARVRTDEPCGERLWAQPAGLPEPTVVPFVSAKGTPLGKAASAALHALPVFAKIQARFATKRKPEEPEGWYELHDYAEGAWSAEGPSGETIVHAAAKVCRGAPDFAFNLEAFWKLSGPKDAPTLTPYGPAAPSEERGVKAATDIDGDGRLDVILRGGFMMARDGGLELPLEARARTVSTCPGASASAASSK